MTSMMMFTVRNDRIMMTVPYNMRDLCKEIPGRRWDGSCWHAPASPSTALDIERKFGQQRVMMDENVKRLLQQGKEQRKAKVLRNAEDLPEIPSKTKAWLHQRQAFYFAREQEAVMLAMDMGTGKSLTAIALLEEWQAQKVLILGPRRALPVWPLEFQKHALRNWHVIVPPLSSPVTTRALRIRQEIGLAEARKQPYVVTVNYESAWRKGMTELLTAVDWDVVILDESHRIKAPGGKQSQFCGRLRKRARRRINLTGTPMPHSPLDIYGQYRFLDPGIFGTSYNRFRNRYAVMGGFEGRQVIGYQNEAELAGKFGDLAFVCKSDDVLDLPEYHHVEHFCDLEPKARRIYDKLDQEFVAGVGDGEITAQNALVKLLRLQQLTGGWLKDDEGVLHRVSTAKEDLYADWLQDFKEGEPLTTFCRFHTDLDAVKAATLGDKRVYGELSGRVKETSLEYGLEGPLMRPDIDMIGVQWQAGGVGIDLTRSNQVGIYSLGYNLGDYEQGIKRNHRHGQVHSVTYHHFIARGTKDEAVYDALRNRKNVVETIIEASKK